MSDLRNSVSKADERSAAKRNTEDEVAISEGVFSWRAAWCMMFWILIFICSSIMVVLAYQGAAFEVISEEISYVKARNPPYGPAEQPNNANMRNVNQYFRYHLPQVALFYSIAASALGLFTVSYFTNYMLLEDQGQKRIVDVCLLISKGVTVYLERTIPMVVLFLVAGGWYVYVTSGLSTLSCFLVGAILNMISPRVGVSISVQGTGRLSHSMGSSLADSLQIGIRSGAIGGLLATSLALGGMATTWLIIADTRALSGFGSGASIVSFYLRVGGGIFSEGAQIGGNLVGEMDDHKHEEERRVFELQQRITELEDRRQERLRKGLADEEADMMDQLRMMEEEMQDVVSLLHPIDYLDAVGENICDVSGTCADLFESMVLILSTSAIIGSKGAAVPSFLAGLPFWIVASGNIGCSVVAYYCHIHERFSSRRIRWSLRLNLIVVIVFVQLVQITVSYWEWLRGTITFTQFWHFVVISVLGQIAPEICVLFGEFFTSVDYYPVRSLAKKSHLGVVQVVLQGLGQGFLSTAFPAVTMVIVVMITWTLEDHYGLALLSASSVSGTGFQGGIACYGSIASNAHKIVHLTTYHSMARHRANICFALGDTALHAGGTISAINAFSAVFNVAVTLLAQTYTRLDMNYKAILGPPLSQWSQAGLVLGVVMTFLFTANTTISCLETSKSFLRFCKTSNEVSRRDGPFPVSHIVPLKILTYYGTITSMRMVFNPMINTLMVPMIGGFFLGTSGLLFLLSGSNVLILCLSLLLLNSGQSWVSARKYILFGFLHDDDGNAIGPDSDHFENLHVGELIGGPFMDTTGPALNNFIKFVAVFSLVTEGLYTPVPNQRTWLYGIATITGSLFLVVFAKFGLTLVLNCVTNYLKQRQLQKDADSEEEEEEYDDDEVEAIEDA
eukprot:TRINITY_DN18574_c0_g2_i1.p1 TRINITY_DN18574_c0_g2~~TRINITY_DN18574_c0_g2_i1.p1  ORF type:complete len:902 (+),score=131.68 TRINITY_DN18574_c0_g2_i1:81-2786(+)